MNSLLVASLAGGVGKTSIVHSLATAIAEYGKRALVVDADPAATLTYLCGIENPRYTSRELFEGSQKLTNIAVKTVDRFTLVPSASRLIQTEFAPNIAVRDQFQEFDFVLIDSPSGPSPLIQPLIEIADQVIAPVDASMLSVRGVLNLRDFIDKSSARPRIRTIENRAKDWDPELKSSFAEDFKLIEVSLHEDSSLPAAQLTTRSLLSESPHSQIAAEMRELGYLLLEEVGLL